MADVSKLTDEELLKIVGGANEAPKAPVGKDLSKLSNEDLQHIADTGTLPPPPKQSLIGSVAKKGLEYAGKLESDFDAFTRAPIRAGIGALQEGQGILGAIKSAKNQFGEDPSRAPTTKDIAAKFGLSTDESIDTGLHLSPYKGGTLRVSPAGLAGAAVDAATDPLTYIGDKPFQLLGKGAIAAGEKVLPKAAKSLGELAENSAVRSTTHHNFAARQNIPENAGRNLLDEGVIPIAGRVESIKPRLEAAEKKYGELIGRIGSEIDHFQPHSVNSEAIAANIRDYARAIPDVGGGSRLKNRLYEEADKIQKLGPLNFKDAQEIKQQFKYKFQDPDALFSNQDVTNKINTIIGTEMENVADFYSRNPPKGLDAHLLKQYDTAKDKYRTFTNTADAARERVEKNKDINLFSPSDKGFAGIAGAATYLGGHKPIETAAVLGLTAIANKLGRERGAAFAANSLDAMSKALSGSTKLLEKYAPSVNQMLAKGANATAIYHHFLMNNDPEYKAAVEADQGSAFDRKLQQKKSGEK